MALEWNSCEVLSWRWCQWLVASTAGLCSGEQGAEFPCLQMVLICTPWPESCRACKRKCREGQGEEDQRSK